MKPEQLIAQMSVAELKPGSTYVLSYDINAISRSSMRGLFDWLTTRNIEVFMLGRDGPPDSLTVYNVLKEYGYANQ
jgi:hypothetical protein